MKAPFKWDEYSDQPALLQDKAYKKSMRKKELFSLMKTMTLALFMLPLSILAMPFVKRKEINSQEFFSMGVDFEKNREQTIEFLEELGAQNILLRFKLWEMHKLEELQEFIENNRHKKIILKVLQDREHIEDLTLLEKDLTTLFDTLQTSVNIYEIGSTINRTKWGFFSVNEYLKFYQVAYKLQKKKFQNIKLIGSGVIDFEYHFTAHTLFNLQTLKYDGISALLYVDRRGAPENTQLGFALSDKIAWLSTLVWLSPKVKQELHITEINWPISNTAPYAPTSEHECVDENSYTDFMLRYHYLAFASQQVESVSWHQLIAPGYGLVDDRNSFHKRPAFQAYKYMLQTLHNAQFLRLDIKRSYYILQCLVDDKLLQIHWSLIETTLKNEDFFHVYDKNGKFIEDEILSIGSAPLYLYIVKASPKKVNCL